MAWSCNDCGKAFADDFRLYQHNLAKLHSCQHCGESTTDRFALMQHMRTHMIYDCHLCSKKFFLNRSLEQHMEMSTHTKKSQTKKPRSRGQRRRNKGNIASGFSGSGASLSSSLSLLSLSPFSSRSSATRTKFIAELEESASIENFLHDKVIPDRNTLEECNRIVERLMNFLHHNTTYNVAKVFKGGSLAKGTSIKTKNDIDITVFLNGFGDVNAISRGMKGILENLRDHLDVATFANEIEFKGTRDDFTRHSVQFKLKLSRDDELHDLDVLPAVDVLEKASGSKENVYRQMQARPRERSFYSVCFGPLQVEFVKKCPTRVKDLIRVVKHWKRTEGVDQLKSYTIELIVIKLWQKWGEPIAFDLKDKLKDVLSTISNLGNLKIVWPECYNISQYEGLPNDPVVVMDPANPFTNTSNRIRQSDVPIIEATARQSLAWL